MVKDCLRNELLEAINHYNNDIGLMLGSSGLLLFYGSNLKLKDDLEKIEELFNNIIQNASDFKSFSLSSGITGFGYVSTYFKKNGFIDSDLNTSLNDSIYYGFDLFLKEENFDYLHGYLGIINYLIYDKNEKLDSQLILDKLYFITNFLVNNRFITDEAINKEMFVANFGLAHGIPSFLSILINYDKLYPCDNTKLRINELSKFIISQRQERIGFMSKYPSSLYKEGISFDKESRLAWCYGDLGVNLALLKSARYLNNKEMEKFIINDLIFLTRRKTSFETSIVDCSLCHGAAGLVYFFKYLYSIYGLSEFKEYYSYWENYIIDKYTQTGIDGLSYYLKSTGWLKERGLLEGYAGIYFSLFFEEFDPSPFNYLFLID